MNAYSKHHDVWERYSDTLDNPNYVESPIMFSQERSYKEINNEPNRIPSPVKIDAARLEENYHQAKKQPEPIVKYPVVQISNQNADGKKKKRGCSKSSITCTTCAVVCVLAVLLILGLVFAFFAIFSPGIYETHTDTDGISLG